jgi:hypothetical protein
MSGGSHISHVSHIPDVEAERPLHDVGGEGHIAKRRMQNVSFGPRLWFLCNARIGRHARLGARVALEPLSICRLQWVARLLPFTSMRCSLFFLLLGEGKLGGRGEGISFASENHCVSHFAQSAPTSGRRRRCPDQNPAPAARPCGAPRTALRNCSLAGVRIPWDTSSKVRAMHRKQGSWLVNMVWPGKSSKGDLIWLNGH